MANQNGRERTPIRTPNRGLAAKADRSAGVEGPVIGATMRIGCRGSADS